VGIRECLFAADGPLPRFLPSANRSCRYARLSGGNRLIGLYVPRPSWYVVLTRTRATGVQISSKCLW